MSDVIFLQYFYIVFTFPGFEDGLYQSRFKREQNCIYKPANDPWWNFLQK